MIEFVIGIICGFSFGWCFCIMYLDWKGAFKK